MRTQQLIALCAIAAAACSSDRANSCLSQDAVQRPREMVRHSPAEVSGSLVDGPQCDDTFGLLYLADLQIASSVDDMFFYQGRLNLAGIPEEQLTPNHRHIIENPGNFVAASETSPIRPSENWIGRVRDPKHWVIGDHEFRLVRLLDAAACEDGDGGAQSALLIERYRAWLLNWPAHEEAPWVRTRIAELSREGSC